MAIPRVALSHLQPDKPGQAHRVADQFHTTQAPGVEQEPLAATPAKGGSGMWRKAHIPQKQERRQRHQQGRKEQPPSEQRAGNGEQCDPQQDKPTYFGPTQPSAADDII